MLKVLFPPLRTGPITLLYLVFFLYTFAPFLAARACAAILAAATSTDSSYVLVPLRFRYESFYILAKKVSSSFPAYFTAAFGLAATLTKLSSPYLTLTYSARLRLSDYTYSYLLAASSGGLGARCVEASMASQLSFARRLGDIISSYMPADGH